MNYYNLNPVTGDISVTTIDRLQPWHEVNPIGYERVGPMVIETLFLYRPYESDPTQIKLFETCVYDSTYALSPPLMSQRTANLKEARSAHDAMIRACKRARWYLMPAIRIMQAMRWLKKKLLGDTP